MKIKTYLNLSPDKLNQFRKVCKNFNVSESELITHLILIYLEQFKERKKDEVQTEVKIQ